MRELGPRWRANPRPPVFLRQLTTQQLSSSNQKANQCHLSFLVHFPSPLHCINNMSPDASSSSQTSAPAPSPSPSPSASAVTPPPFDAAQLAAANASLSDATPQEILAWAVDNLPGLYQTTAFGLTGLAATDMLAKLTRRRKAASHLVPLIFIDTLYHFEETLALAKKVEKKYKVVLSVYRPPEVETTEEFEDKYGKELWKTDEDTYDYLVKVSLLLCYIPSLRRSRRSSDPPEDKSASLPTRGEAHRIDRRPRPRFD